jgi:hypothetical protein
MEEMRTDALTLLSVRKNFLKYVILNFLKYGIQVGQALSFFSNPCLYPLSIIPFVLKFISSKKTNLSLWLQHLPQAQKCGPCSGCRKDISTSMPYQLAFIILKNIIKISVKELIFGIPVNSF